MGFKRQWSKGRRMAMGLIRTKIGRALKKFNEEQLKTFCDQYGLGEFYDNSFKGEHSWHNFSLYVQMVCDRLPDLDLRRKSQEEMDAIMWDIFVNWKDKYYGRTFKIDEPDKYAEYKSMIDQMDGNTRAFIIACILNRSQCAAINYEGEVKGRLIRAFWNDSVGVVVQMDECGACDVRIKV